MPETTLASYHLSDVMQDSQQLYHPFARGMLFFGNINVLSQFPLVGGNTLLRRL